MFSILPSGFLLAQSGSGATFSTGLLLVAAVVILTAIYLVSENLLGIEAHQIGKEVETSGSGSLKSKVAGVKVPPYVKGHFTKLTKGHNILLKGAPSDEVSDVRVTSFAIQPGNFIAMSPIPKVVLNEGDEVLAGQEIFFDKKRPEIKYVSPGSEEHTSELQSH